MTLMDEALLKVRIDYGAEQLHARLAASNMMNDYTIEGCRSLVRVIIACNDAQRRKQPA